MGYIAENSRKFFHPAAINEMLSTFLPHLDGTQLDVSQFSSMRRVELHITISLERLVVSIFSYVVLASKSSTILPPNALPRVGVD